MSELTNEMLVNDLISGIESKAIAIKDVAEYFASSDRTIQKKIKALGFNWDAKKAKYHIEGNEEQQVYLVGLTLDKVFSKGAVQQNNSKNTSTNDGKSESAANTKNDSQTNSVNESKIASNNTSKVNSFGDSDMDRIDEILSGKKPNKKYIGFYAEDDVASVLDSIEGRIKSELINECLRVVFKSKGLL